MNLTIFGVAHVKYGTFEKNVTNFSIAIEKSNVQTSKNNNKIAKVRSANYFNHYGNNYGYSYGYGNGYGNGNGYGYGYGYQQYQQYYSDQAYHGVYDSGRGQVATTSQINTNQQQQQQQQQTFGTTGSTTINLQIVNIRYFQVWDQAGLKVDDNDDMERVVYPSQQESWNHQVLAHYRNRIPITKHCAISSEPLNKTTHLVVTVSNPNGNELNSMIPHLQPTSSSSSSSSSLFLLTQIITNQTTINAHFSTCPPIWERFSATCNCRYDATFSAQVWLANNNNNLKQNNHQNYFEQAHSGGGGSYYPTEKINLTMSFDYVQISGMSMKRVGLNDLNNWSSPLVQVGHCLITCHACFCNHNEQDFQYDWWITSTRFKAISNHNQVVILSEQCTYTHFEIHCGVRSGDKFKRFKTETSENLRYRMENNISKLRDLQF